MRHNRNNVYKKSLSMKLSVIYSIIMHIIIFILFTLGIPEIKKEVPKNKIFFVDTVNISDITNAKKASQVIKKDIGPTKAMPEKTTHSIPMHKVIENIKEIKDIQKMNLNNAPIMNLPSKDITIKEDLPKNTQQKIQDNKNDHKHIKEKEIKKQDVEKKKTNDKQKSNDQKQYSEKVLKSLKGGEKKHIEDDKKIMEKTFQDLESLFESDSDQEFNDSLPITASELDSIRGQIKKSWNPIAFNGSGSIMKVTLLMKLDKTGTVIEIKPILEKNHNVSYNAFVESVIRAAKKASPLQNLNPNKFQTWKDMEMVFSSEDMMY